MTLKYNLPGRQQLSFSAPSLLSCDCFCCREMLETPGPYLLDVMVPHIEHVLPMIPGGGSYKDIITTGDGSIEHY